MALTETQENDKIEVVNRWHVQVRKASIVKKDGKETTTTKAEHEAAYQAKLDAEAAASVRAKRDELLAKSDWVTIRAKELGQDVPIAWYNYRGDLRQIPEQSGFPHDVTFPTEPS